MEQLEQELGVAGGERLAAVQVAESKERRCRAVAAIRWMSPKVMWSMSLRSRRCRRRRHGAGDDFDGAGGRGASRRIGRGRWRPELRRRRRRGASEPKAFLLLKQAGEGVAEARRRCGVRHAGAERWERAGDVGDGGVPAWRTGCGAWPNQQRGLKEQAGPFLQGVLLGGRSRCWTVIKLVISPINLNKI